MSLGVEVVGVGWVGFRHVEAIEDLTRSVDTRLHVEMLVDAAADQLAKRASSFGVAKTATSLHPALSDPNVGAVSIATPHGLHRCGHRGG